MISIFSKSIKRNLFLLNCKLIPQKIIYNLNQIIYYQKMIQQAF